MNTIVVLPFDKGGETWHDKDVRGVQVRQDISDWFVKHGIYYARAFRSKNPHGFPTEVVFYFNSKAEATLFKLTWG